MCVKNESRHNERHNRIYAKIQVFQMQVIYMYVDPRSTKVKVIAEMQACIRWDI
jgi:hypothetical protein